jgi:hypothetical protein
LVGALGAEVAQRLPFRLDLFALVGEVRAKRVQLRQMVRQCVDGGVGGHGERSFRVWWAIGIRRYQESSFAFPGRRSALLREKEGPAV